MRHGPVLIVEDDDGMRGLLVELLEDAGFETTQARTGEEAVALVRRFRPGVVLLDVHLPGISGYEVCRVLRERFGEQLPIVFLSGARTGADDVAAGLLLGGDDYVTKPFSPGELVARVRRALIRASDAQGSPDTQGLTRRELEILRLLAEGLSQDRIATELTISPHTVATHIQRILLKLDAHSRAEAVAFAYRNRLIRADGEAHALTTSND